MDHSRCSQAYTDTIDTYGDLSLKSILEVKKSRGYGNSKELTESGLSRDMIKDMVLKSLASNEQAKCNKNPSTY